MREIYVVIGTTGEYSDKTEWPVKAFFDLSKAEDVVVKATARAAELDAKRESRYRAGEEKNEYDPNMQMDYTGTWYEIMKVYLEE